MGSSQDGAGSRRPQPADREQQAAPAAATSAASNRAASTWATACWRGPPARGQSTGVQPQPAQRLGGEELQGARLAPGGGGGGPGAALGSTPAGPGRGVVISPREERGVRPAPPCARGVMAGSQPELRRPGDPLGAGDCAWAPPGPKTGTRPRGCSVCRSHPRPQLAGEELVVRLCSGRRAADSRPPLALLSPSSRFWSCGFRGARGRRV